VFDSDDVVFAWVIGKALLIVIVSFIILVYLAWAASWQWGNAMHFGISKNPGKQCIGKLQPRKPRRLRFSVVGRKQPSPISREVPNTRS
jgi:hypothetical protein